MLSSQVTDLFPWSPPLTLRMATRFNQHDWQYPNKALKHIFWKWSPSLRPRDQLTRSLSGIRNESIFWTMHANWCTLRYRRGVICPLFALNNDIWMSVASSESATSVPVPPLADIQSKAHWEKLGLLKCLHEFINGGWQPQTSRGPRASSGLWSECRSVWRSGSWQENVAGNIGQGSRELTIVLYRARCDCPRVQGMWYGNDRDDFCLRDAGRPLYKEAPLLYRQINIASSWKEKLFSQRTSFENAVELKFRDVPLHTCVSALVRSCGLGPSHSLHWGFPPFCGQNEKNDLRVICRQYSGWREDFKLALSWLIFSSSIYCEKLNFK